MNAYIACVHCRHRNYTSARFCAQCGHALTRTCHECDTQVQASDVHCHQCGTKLTSLAEAPDNASASDTGESSLSDDHLELRQVTVQFCDLCGSTDLSDKLDPEDLGRVLRLYQDACTPIVQAHDGYISRYMGDGILSLFGFPTTNDDAAFQAVLAGLEIVEYFRMHPITIDNNSWNLSVRIGVATGMVLAGDLIGSGHATEQPVVGQTPNLAARLQSVAVENSVVISERTHRLVGRQISCSKLGPLSLKGISGPVDAYQALHLPTPVEARDLYPLSYTSSGFVNRLQEMSCLMGAWERTRESNGQAVLITAEPGMGKSRLWQEFINRVDQNDLLLVSLKCSSTTSNTPLHPLIELLLDESVSWSNSLLSQLDSSIGTDDSVAITQVLDELIEALKLLSAGSAPEQPLHRHPSDLFIDLVKLVSQYVPVALCLEDVHWADPTTLSIMARLNKDISNRKVLSVFLARPIVELDSLTPDVVVKLDRLSENDACQIVNNQVGFDSLPDPLLNVILSKSEGIPLFIEEVTNSLIDYRARLQRDGMSETADPSEFTVPDTLRDLLTARLDSLGNAKRLAQLASVIGREFTLKSITELSDLPAGKLMVWVNTLLASGLVQALDSDDSNSFQFKHALIQDAAYESLTRTQKTGLHARMAEILLQAAEHDTLKIPEQIAGHYHAAGQLEKAAYWWNRASGNALSLSANREALHHARQGIGLLDDIPESAERDHVSLSLHIYLSAAIASTLGDATPELEAVHATATALLQRVDDDRLAFALTREMHAFSLIRGPVQRACELGRTLLKLAESRENPQIRLDSLRSLGWTYVCHGQLEEGRDLLKLSTTVYRKAESRLHTQHDTIDPGAVGLINLAWVETLMDNENEAKKLVARASGLAAEIEHPYSLAYSLCMGGAVYQCQNKPQKVLNLVDQALGIASKNGYFYWAAWGGALRGWALSMLDQSADGLKLLAMGQKQYEATGARLFLPHILSLQADALTRNREYNDAINLLEQAIIVADENGIHFFSSETYRLLAVAQEKMGFHQEANRLFEKAAELADQQGAKAFGRRIRLDIESYSSNA